MRSKNSCVSRILEQYLPKWKADFFGNFSRLSRVVDLIKLHTDKNDRILDLGSGPLILAYLLEEEGHRNIVCIDKNPTCRQIYDAFRQAKLIKHATFKLGDITDLDLRDDAFDFVIIYDVLCFDIDLERLLVNVNKTLRKNGKLCFDIWSELFFRTYESIYRRLYSKYLSFKSQAIPEINAYLERCGFQLVEILPMFASTITSSIVQKVVWYLTRSSIYVLVWNRDLERKGRSK